MAAQDIFPDAGLDYLLGIFPKNGTNASTLYLGLFKGGTASTVPTSAATLAAMTGTFAEVTTTDYPGYARVAIAAGDWGAAAGETLHTVVARVVTAAQKSFPAATSAATPSAPINGFFICNVASGTAGVPVYFSNFDDEVGIASLAIGDIVRVTPKLGFGG
jgi:hypothetical protein